LDREALLPDANQTLSRIERCNEPVGCLQPEGDRHCLLQERPASYQCFAVSACEVCAGGSHREQSDVEPVERALGYQHDRRVENVLRGGAEVDEPGGMSWDGRS
jgi:hypothetical protein